MKKLIISLLLLALLCGVAIGSLWLRGSYYITWPWAKRLEVPRLPFDYDKDGDGIDDLWDIYLGAKAEVARKPVYKDGYFAGGYPPETEGVCTDVVWRALRDAGFNLKALVDEDIKNNLELYPRVNNKPEPNIDFRRAQNLSVFFTRYAEVLTNEVVPWDSENLVQWQPGDIVVWAAPAGHIGIISSKRRADGVPYVLHNSGPWAREQDVLLSWPSPIIGHYRFPKLN